MRCQTVFSSLDVDGDLLAVGRWPWCECDVNLPVNVDVDVVLKKVYFLERRKDVQQ